MESRMGYSAIVGTLYLKQAYQKNMVMALMIGVMLHLAGLGTYALLTQAASPPLIEVLKNIDYKLDELPPPPPLGGERSMDDYEIPESAIPKFGVPEAVKDWEALESIVMATRDQKDMFVNSGPNEPGLGPGGSGPFTVVIKDIPQPPPIDSFILVDRFPEIIHLEEPVYPEMARKAGFEGMLIIRVLIDVDGSVRDARIVKPSGTNVGFEQAAIDAAMKIGFAPALQNDHAVMCWYSYTVVFSLD